MVTMEILSDVFLGSQVIFMCMLKMIVEEST